MGPLKFPSLDLPLGLGSRLYYKVQKRGLLLRLPVLVLELGTAQCDLGRRILVLVLISRFQVGVGALIYEVYFFGHFWWFWSISKTVLAIAGVWCTTVFTT